ncbi:MAG: FAD-dependent oxidoreductase [Anaerolineae bacterium]|nr:FAD-dependent oxidoreductase [Anaerolineae bacterium]MDK1081843.1 FAD-dependent oxidoreductase [Anaerolineae bacterium]
MAKVVVVGDGPAGLSAALFLAKLNMDVTVFGVDKTSMHDALLYNYLGIPEMTGSDFQKIARKQVTNFGAEIQKKLVTSIEKKGDGFITTTEDDENYESKYVVLAEGKAVKLNIDLGLTKTAQNVDTGPVGKTDIENLYVVGRSTSILRTQAIISAGQGAAAALDILSTELDRDIRDFDEV